MLAKLQIHYIKNFYKKLTALKTYIDNENYDKLRMLGHKLKGSGASYGYQEITNIGIKINELAHKKNLEKIKKEYDLLTSYIVKQKKKLDL